MPFSLLIGLGAGLVSALLFASASTGTLLGLLVLVFLTPLPVAITGLAIVWIVALLLVRISSVAGIVAAVSAPVSVAILGRHELFAMVVLFALLVLWRHHANISRLLAGKEPKIGERK